MLLRRQRGQGSWCHHLCGSWTSTTQRTLLLCFPNETWTSRMDLHQETFRLTDGSEKKHMDVRVQLLAANCPAAFLISPGHFENGHFLRVQHLHISSACFQRRCLGPFGEISGVRDVDFALNCGCVFLSFLKFGRVDYFRISSTQRARSMPTLFLLSLMPVFFTSFQFASASPTLTWQSHSEDLPRSMSGECFGGACAVLPVPQVASFPTSFQFWCLQCTASPALTKQFISKDFLINMPGRHERSSPAARDH